LIDSEQPKPVWSDELEVHGKGLAKRQPQKNETLRSNRHLTNHDGCADAFHLLFEALERWRVSVKKKANHRYLCGAEHQSRCHTRDREGKFNNCETTGKLPHAITPRQSASANHSEARDERAGDSEAMVCDNNTLSKSIFSREVSARLVNDLQHSKEQNVRFCK